MCKNEELILHTLSKDSVCRPTLELQHSLFLARMRNKVEDIGDSALNGIKKLIAHSTKGQKLRFCTEQGLNIVNLTNVL